MYATKHIDWLSITVFDRKDVDEILPGARWHYVGSGHHGYKTAFEDSESGARVETDSPISGMDTHLTIPGSALHVARLWHDAADDGILQSARSVGARTSRIDLALNIHQGRLTVLDFFSAYKTGDLKTAARKGYFVEGIGGDRAGDTLYFGSPKSSRQCRIYNKAAEQAIVDGESWLRLELALRDLRAKSIVAASKDNSVASITAATLADVVDWSNSEYRQSLAGEFADIHPLKRKRPAVEKWLLKQCAPALARVYNVKPEFMVEFMTSFRQSLDKLKPGD